MADARRGSFPTTWKCVRSALPFGAIFLIAYVGQDGIAPAPPAGTPKLSLAALAGAQVDWGCDQDGDGLSDDVEKLVGTDSFVADTDGDGYADGAEWVLASSPTDAASLPDPRPAVRSCAYEVGGQIRVFCLVFPANLEFVDTFHLFVGSPSFDLAPLGDPGSGVGMYDISSMLASVVGSFTETTFLGLNIVGFDFDIDRAMLVQAGRLNVAWASQLAGVPVVDQMYFGIEGTTDFVLASGPVAFGAGAALTVEPLALVPPPGDEQPEYCEISLSGGTATGVASVEYEVASAGCEPDGLLYCIGADCAALAGQKFVLIDYGYLQSKAGE